MKLSIVLIACVIFICLHSYSQQPVLSVQRFEYIWEPAISDPAFKRVILASVDTIKQKIEKSFASALQQRWNLSLPENVLSVKPLPLFSFSYEPKFNTKLKDKQPNTWYLFLQIFDKNNSSVYDVNGNTFAAILEIKCRLVNGSNDSVIVNKTLLTTIYREIVSPDQVVLEKLPAYPADFINAFDSIAIWLFQPGSVNEKNISLKQACVYTQEKFSTEPLAQLLFKTDDENIQYLSQPSFSLHIIQPEYKVTKVNKNAAGNTAGGALTLFTGLNFNKERVYEYNADYSFEENSSIYHCVINYAEKESAERHREKTTYDNDGKWYSLKSGSYTISERRVNPGVLNSILLDKDTVATFKIVYTPKNDEQKNYKQFWNGMDTATVINLPKKWNNSNTIDNVTLSGNMQGSTFLMKTSNGTTGKEFYINNKIVLIVYGKTAPQKAVLFQSLSPQQLKIFTILSSLPYDYFNYSVY